jgi:type IV secretion system protein TrbF
MATPQAVPKSWSPEGDLNSPYKRARQEWDDRMGSARVQAKNWRIATFVSLGIVVLSIGGLVYLGAQPKSVPHIVEIDQLGAASYRGPVGKSNWTPTEASIRYHLRRFVDLTRTVSSDPAVMKRNWTDAYTLVTPNAANMLTAHVEKNDPFKRVENERVSVEVSSIVRVSKETWQVDWKETTWGKNGQQLGSFIWRGMLRTVVNPPESDELLIKNPIGLYIDEFHWDRVQQ